MAFTEYTVNSYDFSEVTESDVQVQVTNNLGRTALDREIVNLDGYVGEVVEYGGIANAASGRININHERTIRTAQIQTTDTFVVGQPVYFLSGGSAAAGKLRATNESGSVVYGKCIGFGGTGGAHTYVEVRPFSQVSEAIAGATLKMAAITVPLGSTTTPVVYTDIPVGSLIVNVVAHATVSNASGTVTVSDGTNAITNAITMAVIDTLTTASTIDHTYAKVIAAGLTLTANADTDAGVAYVYYL